MHKKSFQGDTDERVNKVANYDARHELSGKLTGSKIGGTSSDLQSPCNSDARLG
jgi:hypothetical protein